LATSHPESIAGDLLALLPASPDAYPQQLDPIRDAVLVIRFDAASYRAASFLDDRILGPDTQGAWLPVGAIRDAMRGMGDERAVHFIFHTGHVGSTLVSRLLDETGDVLPLREPLPLRTLADAADVLALPESLLSAAQFDSHLAMFTRLWGRGYGDTRRVVLKATSAAGRLAVPLLARSAPSRAIYMNLRAEPYLAALLAGQNSPVDLRGHGPGRIRRLQSRLDTPLTPLHDLSLGELAAMSWLAESWTRNDALETFGDRVVALDFDDFLADVPEGMRLVLRHFGLTFDPPVISRLMRSPVLTRYSKAPEYEYTPGTRSELIAASRRANREEIRRGMAWLQRMAGLNGAVAAVVDGAAP
jgi:hypothetical protein